MADDAGTELGLAVDAAQELEKDGKKCRVVSMVSWELFEEQDQQYKVTPFIVPTASTKPFAVLAC